MPHYRAVGEVPRKRHTRSGGLRGAGRGGGVLGRLVAAVPPPQPSALLAVEQVDGPATGVGGQPPLLPRHLRPAKLSECADPVTGRTVLAGNDTRNLAGGPGGPAIVALCTATPSATSSSTSKPVRRPAGDGFGAA